MSEKKYANDTAKEQILAFLDQTVDNMGLDLDADFADPDQSIQYFENPELVVDFIGDDAEMLLENKAELLLALEHLTMEMLRVPPEDHSLICFDTNDRESFEEGVPRYLKMIQDAGYAPDLQLIMRELDIHYVNRSEGNWAVLRSAAPDSLKLLKRPVEDKTVPNVTGMGLRDALFLLENKGLQVRISGGYGRVQQQSIAPGTRAAGQTVFLRLG